MASSKAQNASSASANSPANAKSNGGIKVVMPDANGDFSASIPKSAVEKVQVVDVDMVLQLKDGTSVVLAGGAIGAMDAGHTEVKFNDGPSGLSKLLDQVGAITIPKLDPILSSLQAPPTSQGQEHGSSEPSSSGASGMSASITSQIVNQLTQIVQANAQSVTIKTVDPSAQVAVLSQNTKTGDADSKALEHVEPPVPPEKQGVVPQQHIIGPDAPAMALTLVNLTTITQIGSVLYGSGGTPGSAIDGSNNAQFASQVINAPANATEIHAVSNIPANDFIKVVNIALTGNGIAQSITVKGVPAGMSIANGSDLGGGIWSVPVASGQRSYDLQLEYSTTPADPSAPIHAQFSLEFDVSLSTGTGIAELSQVKQFVVKDVVSANDLTFIDSTTGESVYVLPAQGNSHIIHAGDAGVTIFGSNAADFLYGGAGADTINGGSGNTYLEGGGGADHLNGGAGGVNTAGYTLSAAGVTVDLVNGVGTGGDAQGDTLTNISNVIGSTHNDTIISSLAANNINGGGGVDTVSYAGSAAAVIVDLTAGAGAGGNAAGDKLTGIQNVIGSVHNDTFLASAAANAFDGGGHDLNGVDTVSYANDTSGAGVVVDLSAVLNGARTGGAAAGDTYTGIQNIIGTSFNDTFIDGVGANRYDGGIGGRDTVSYVDSLTGVNVNFVTGRGTGGSAEGDSYVNIQNVLGSSFDDTFTAGGDSKQFDGGAGGLDTVSYAGAASSVIIDTIANLGHGAAEGNNYIHIQKFVGGGSNDTFIASLAANSFDGGIGGSDTVDYSNSNAAVTVDLFHTDGSGTGGGYAAGDVFANIANVIGGAGDDTFIANAAQNSFEGGLGNNTVSYQYSTSANGIGVTVDLSATDGSGTGGNFALGDKYSNIQNVIGSIFNDTFIAGSAANIITGFGGNDTVSYANSTSTDAIGVTVDLSTAVGTGSGDFAQGDTYIGIQNATGSAFNDTFIASSVANIFTGGGGSDTVSYAPSAAAVNIDLVNGVGTGGDAQGDQYIGIQNIIGSALDDTFIDSATANIMDGGITSLHNRVSYANSVSSPGVAAGVTVDLTATDGSGTSGGYAAGDHLLNIQDLTGGAADDTFVASLAANNLDGGASTAASHNRVSYAKSVDGGGAAAGVIVDLVAGTGTGGYAQGDTYTNIQDVTGSAADDTIIDSAAANAIDGGITSLHNRVSYANSVTSAGAAAGVTVDLNFADGSGTSGGYATGDHLVNIQDLTGGAADDTFVASAAVNFLDGGASTSASHNRVSYLASVDGLGAAAGVTVDLVAGTGVGGYAQGDTYANIQDVTGSNAADTIIASLASNHLDGAGGVDTVSYASALNGVGVTVDLFTGLGSGVGSFAENDTYANIENVIGTQNNDTFFAGAAANQFTGGGGIDTVDYSHANDGNGVTVDLINGAGTGGFAAGDVYVGIQNATGTVNNDTFIGNSLANVFVGFGGVDTVNYAASGVGVTVDFSTATGTGAGGLAQGDTYVGIRNAIGSQFDDTFIANTTVSAGTADAFDGGAGTLHNRVSYAGTGTAVTVDLSAGVGTVGAIGDTYANIQDVTGTALDDTIVASLAANNIDGGATSLHNRVSYAASIIGGVATGVTVDLVTGAGLGGFAQGDLLTNIQDLTGSGADDMFIASAVNNNFDGGAGSDTVSYAKTTGAIGVTVNLFSGAGAGGFAAGDTYANIENIIGSNNDDTFIDGSGALSNSYTGGTGSNTVSYVNSNAAVTVNLFTGQGSGGFAANDLYNGIQNVIGSTQNDTFIDGSGTVANTYTGSGGVDTISYANSTAGVTVNFATGGGTGSFAQGDVYVGIRNVLGSLFDDIFTAGTATTLATSNAFDGNTGTLHNRVSYAGTAGSVTVDLSSGLGAGNATGDTYANIQDVTGTTSDDTFVASLAANSLDGGATSNHNVVSYAASTGAVNVNLLTGAGTLGFAAGDTYANIQDVIGSGFDDTFVASNVANNFNGGAGLDTVDYTTSGAVNVNLSAGTATGGLAQGDTYVNIENIIGSAFSDTFVANSLANVFNGGTAGSDTVSYSASGSGVTASLLAGVVGSGGDAAGDTFINITNLTGSGFNDSLTGLLGGGSTLNGGVGNDTLIASGGNNTLIGGTGNDTMTAGGDNNIFTGGAGSDTMTGSGGLNNTADYTGSAAVTINLTTGAGSGGDAAGDVLSGIQNVKGSANNDTFVANAAANVFTGNGGIDTVSYVSSASAVNASLLAGVLGSGGDAAGDSLTGVTNLIGSAFNDTLTGLLGGSSTLTGNAGNDILIATGGGNTLIGGAGSDTMTATGLNNTATYAGTNNAVTVDLTFTNGAGTSGGDAGGDILSGIQNLIGTGGDDKFILNHGANIVDGGTGSNTVSYEHETTVNVTVDLSGAGIANGDGAFGAQDTLTNIQNAIGGGGNDVFIAGAANNFFDGRGGVDTVSYANNAVGANVAGVTVDLHGNTGSGNWAANDTYANIENVIGTAGNDTFIDAGDGVHNAYDGGVNGVGSNDTVSYQYAASGGTLTLSIDGTHANAGNATGDTFSHIANLAGSSTLDTTIWGDGNANILTAMGSTNTNILNGGGGGAGTDILDGRLGGHDTLVSGATGATIFDVNATGTALGTNIDQIVGSATADTTVKMFNLGATLDISTFSASVTNGGTGPKVSHITTLDLSGDGVGTQISISANDVIALGNNNQLSVRLDNGDSISLVTPATQHAVLFGNGDYAFFDNASGAELARIHQLH